jgi:ABC-type nitrate/sulfonate/bicarbonate transport system substrate-binding protein
VPGPDESSVIGRPSRRQFVRLAAGGAVGLSLGCSASRPTPAAPPAAPAVQAPATPRAPDVVKRGNLRGITFGAAMAAARGYFTDEGIQDEESVFSQGAQQVQAVAVGDLDVGTSSNTAAFFNALARGIRDPFTCDNSHMEAGNRGFMVCLRPDLAEQIREAADLRGRPALTTTPIKDGGVGFACKKMLASVGLDLDDVDWIVVSYPDMPAALGNRQADAAIVIEPFVTLGVQREAFTLWLRLSDYDPGEQVAGLIFSQRFIDERPDVARRWMVANVRGLRDFNDFLKGRNHDVIAPIIAKHTGLPEDVVRQMDFFLHHPDGLLNLTSLMEAQQQLLAWGAIKELLPRELIVDHRFVEYAVQQLGPYRG